MPQEEEEEEEDSKCSKYEDDDEMLADSKAEGKDDSRHQRNKLLEDVIDHFEQVGMSRKLKDFKR